jgi:hypothetical protein
MTKITPGSTIIGKSGKALIVDRVDGDTIHSGELKILISAVVRVIPPKKSIRDFLKVGDRVYIPACDKHGVIERISHVDGKKGLFARVDRDDGITRNILVECLEVAR